MDFLNLPNGIPSHDTFGRIFARLDPKGFQNFFGRWVQDLSGSLNGKNPSTEASKQNASRLNGIAITS